MCDFCEDCDGDVMDRCAKAEAEIARLRAELEDMRLDRDGWRMAENSLLAELERVKAELDKTRIISGHHTIKLANADAELETVRQLAREALVFDYEVPLGHREVMKAFDTLRQIAQEVEK